MIVAVAQIRDHSDDRAASIATHVRLARAAADRGASFVLFPELSITGYDLDVTAADALDGSDPLFVSLSVLARERSIVIAVGAPLLDSERRLVIGNLSFLPDGSFARYTKQYLHSGEDITFAPGDGGALLHLSGHTIGLAICAEITHASHIAESVQRGAEIYAASCLISPNGYDADVALLQDGARRHGVLTLMANYTGPSGGYEGAGRSAIWNSDGRLLASAPPDGECLVMAERDPRGDWAAVALNDERRATPLG